MNATKQNYSKTRVVPIMDDDSTWLLPNEYKKLQGEFIDGMAVDTKNKIVPADYVLCDII